MMEAVQTSETSANSYQSTRRYNPEYRNLLQFLLFKKYGVAWKSLCETASTCFEIRGATFKYLPYKNAGVWKQDITHDA
jgi:hypothetical protein